MGVSRDVIEVVTGLLRRIGLTGEVVSGAADAATPAPDPLDQLKKLAELREADAITPLEFEETKRKLLAKVHRDAAR